MKIALLNSNYVRIASLMFCLIFFSCLKFFVMPLFFAKKYVCLADHHLSHAYSEVIERKINAISQADQTSCSIITHLKNEFPFLKKIEFSYFPHASVVHTKTHAPRCVINNESVLTNNNMIVDKSIYYPPTIESLPHVEIKNEALKNAPLLSAFIDGLPKNVHLFYDIFLFSQHDVLLRDKNEPRFYIKCCADQLITPATLINCEIIKKKISEQEKNSKNKNIAWMADIRFANQIVVYKKMWGKSWHVL